MAIKNYSLAHVPGPKDRNRYKLNLACEEKDAHKLADKLGDISSRPFHSPDMSFDFSLFLYGVTREMKEKLLSQLKMLIDAQPEVSSTGEKKEEDEVRPGKLKPGYTFKKFVVGANTRFTYAACKAVAENPGKNYNPLFIYGGVGLGKTHLMQSIGNYALENFKGIKVVYISTQEFINEIIDAIEEGKIKDVREKYKKVDVLLIDDIQFLQQSEATQEEFFLIFNEMHDVGKQIVITSDKPPKQLVTLEDRLKSRFEWGLTADIKTPNFETRKAIFKKKAEEKGLKLEEKFVTYIAERLTSNIRELEGIINRISAYNKLSGDSIDFKLIKEIVSSVGNESVLEDESEEKKESPPAPPSQKQSAPEPDLPHPPPQTYFSPPPQQPPPAQMTPGCVYCGRNLVFIPQYRKWYCHGCGQYQDLPGMSHTAPAPFSPAAAPPGKKCAKCSAPMSYISRYNRFYCYNCREYDSEARERQEKDMVPPPPEEKKVTKQPSPPETGEEELNEAEEKKEQEESKEDEEKEAGFETRVIGEEKKDIRKIRAGYFIPVGAQKDANRTLNKLGKLATEKKFNFYIKPLFTHYYEFSGGKINYDKMAHMAKTNKASIALCMDPGPASGISIDDFRMEVGKAMEKEDVPFEVLSRGEIKESDALNLMLDVAICARK